MLSRASTKIGSELGMNLKIIFIVNNVIIARMN